MGLHPEGSRPLSGGPAAPSEGSCPWLLQGRGSSHLLLRGGHTAACCEARSVPGRPSLLLLCPAPVLPDHVWGSPCTSLIGPTWAPVSIACPQIALSSKDLLGAQPGPRQSPRRVSLCLGFPEPSVASEGGRSPVSHHLRSESQPRALSLCDSGQRLGLPGPRFPSRRDAPALGCWQNCVGGTKA